MSDLSKLDKIEEGALVTVAEARQVIAGMIKQYPVHNIDVLKEVSFACVNYIHYSREKFGKDDLACELMFEGKMPDFKILSNGEIELIWNQI